MRGRIKSYVLFGIRERSTESHSVPIRHVREEPRSMRWPHMRESRRRRSRQSGDMLRSRQRLRRLLGSLPGSSRHRRRVRRHGRQCAGSASRHRALYCRTAQGTGHHVWLSAIRRENRTRHAPHRARHERTISPATRWKPTDSTGSRPYQRERFAANDGNQSGSLNGATWQLRGCRSSPQTCCPPVHPVLAS